MTDLIRRHIYAQKAKLVRGSSSSQVAMETACKEEAYDEILAYIDKLEMREGPTAQERYRTVLDAAQLAVGAILSPARTEEDVEIRLLVIKQMRDEGYSNAVIGVLLGRDHSTVSYNYKVVNEMLAMPSAFPKFMRVYKFFKGALK